MRLPFRYRGAAACAVAALLLGLWLAWPSPPDDPVPGGMVRIDASPQPMRPERAPAATGNQAATQAWLLGTWSLRDDGGVAGAPCDPQSVITYLPGGQYFAMGASGRYALGGGTISSWGRILYDVDAGEDRSHFEERVTEPVRRIGDHAMQRGDLLLYRCDKTAS